jgi:aryl-alcohol dehydrogenase-like predicted oxidoreductase
MQTRTLGTAGLTVSALGLGTMGMSSLPGKSGVYGPADEAEAILTIHRALDLGVNFFDTAEVYGPYINEELVGKALKGRRTQAVIATKFGFRIGADGAISGTDGTPANARRALDASLQRLGVDCIDLWYLHRLDRAVPIEDTVGAMADAVKSGKVRFLGLSEVGVATLTRAHAVHAISALQSEWSLWERNLEADVLGAARRLGVGIVPFSPLGRGFLTGRVQRAEEFPQGDYRRNDPRYQGANFDANQRIVTAVTAIATRLGATPGQVALAWLLHQGDDVVPIPGTKRRRYLEENAAAAALTLTRADLDALNTAAPPGVTAGPRYSEKMQAMVDR